jgi:hypothetical protein
MAGRRRRGPGEPKTFQVRQANRSKRHGAKLAEADTPAKQIGAVCDHYRAALQFVPPAVAERITRQAIDNLRRSIAELEREEARRG